jgi:SAM-dependent methyltransferase
MTDNASDNASAWGMPNVLAFFDAERATTADVYPSEWFFLKDLLREDISVLDVGCAQGGFAAILGEHLTRFSYTGLDINAEMIARAEARFPDHQFHRIDETGFGLGAEARFDLVLVLGILHLHETWRDTLARAWAHTKGTLLFDLRESDGPTIEDKSRAYFKMDFNGGDAAHAETRLPYNIVNAGDALAVAKSVCPGAARIENYRYLHPVSHSAVTPVAEVMASVYCARR